MLRRPFSLYPALFILCAILPGAWAADLNIVDHGAVGDGQQLNTEAIQATIDAVAADGGGTVVVPEGVFVSGALFLKPGVNLHLTEGSVLQCSTDMANFPEQRTRIEGHFEESFNPALINADGCDGLRITGAGTLDGAGRPIWDQFWRERRASADPKNFENLSVPRARLSLIQNARDVRIEGITFKDSQFWNLHLYNCQEVRIQGVRFTVPDDYRQVPSSDGIDVDSCQEVEIRECYFSVTDDCIALKGTKGPFALKDKQSQPVQDIYVSDCEFRRGHGALTCGSEATAIRDVVVENCEVTGSMPLLRLKLRGDTPQRYKDFTLRGISIQAPGAVLFDIRGWSQYFDLKGQTPPPSIVRDITLANISGSLRSLGVIEGNANTEISDITLREIALDAREPNLHLSDRVQDFSLHQVIVNGEPFALKR